MVGRKGLYEIILVFFLVVVLIFAVIFFLYVNTSSSLLYGKLKKSTSSTHDAVLLKDALLACHRIDYLDVSLLDEQCEAKQMLHGFDLVQLPLNGCQEHQWNYSRSEYTQTIPFVVTMQQLSGQRCIARLLVRVGETA
jgi:hypothetical protein